MAGTTLRYFESEEGLVALQQDPLLATDPKQLGRSALPPPKVANPASAGGCGVKIDAAGVQDCCCCWCD
jgi:hypothetical protein